MLNWPAVIKHSGDAELIYVRSQAEWDRDPDLHRAEYGAADRLIDSTGNVFALAAGNDGCARPQPGGGRMELQEFLGLVKAHAAQTGSCCVAKLYAPTIAAAFRIIESLDEA